MAFKTCFKCKQRKVLEQFYRHPQMADGYLNKCVACTKKDSRTHYRSAWSQIRVYERERNQTPARKAMRKIYDQNRRLRKPGKKRANTWVSNAIRDGRIVRLPCEVCKNPKSEAHHDDYRKPQRIRWLCFKHHREHHGQAVK